MVSTASKESEQRNIRGESSREQNACSVILILDFLTPRGVNNTPHPLFLWLNGEIIQQRR